MSKRKLLSIRVNPDQFEDVLGEELDNGLGVAKSSVWGMWAVFDLKSGLFVVRASTKKKVLSKLESYFKENGLLKIEKSRKAQFYQVRCLEMERHKMYV